MASVQELGQALLVFHFSMIALTDMTHTHRHSCSLVHTLIKNTKKKKLTQRHFSVILILNSSFNFSANCATL